MASPTKLQSYPSKPRVFILSYISNEPDDAESLVRYLLYSSQHQTEGLCCLHIDVDEEQGLSAEHAQDCGQPTRRWLITSMRMCTRTTLTRRLILRIFDKERCRGNIIASQSFP